MEYHVVEACRGDFGMSWRTPRVSWERTHVVEDTMGVVDNDDHVVEVCRGECVSWRCVVGPNVGCRGDEGTSSFSDHVVEVCRGERMALGGVVGTALGCRGDAGTMFVFGPCRGSVSWRMCVVGGCRGYHRKVSWGLTMSWRCVVEDVRFGTMSWRCVVENGCRGGVSWAPA